MKIIKTKNYQELSQVAAMFLIQEASKGYDEKVNIAITGGSTPLGMYKLLQGNLNLGLIPNVHYYNFDEIPLKNKEEGLTLTGLREVFFTPHNIPTEQIHVFNENNYTEFDQHIQNEGGLDFVMMGLGKDGHFCGNLSGTLDCFDEGCRAVDNRLNPTLQARIEFLCNGKENVTDYYVTFGPKTIMNTKKIVMIVSGKDKAEILKQIVSEKISPLIPSTIFQLHPNFIIIADVDALSLI